MCMIGELIVYSKLWYHFRLIERLQNSVTAKLYPNFNVNILSKKSIDDFPIIANHVEISFIENIDNFNDQDWNSLYKLSEKTFVEETDSLKTKGAGAGLTDND